MRAKVITGSFENGVIVPAQKVKIREHQTVTIIVPGKARFSKVTQVANKIKGGLDHKTIEQIIESAEMGEGID